MSSSIDACHYRERHISSDTRDVHDNITICPVNWPKISRLKKADASAKAWKIPVSSFHALSCNRSQMCRISHRNLVIVGHNCLPATDVIPVPIIELLYVRERTLGGPNKIRYSRFMSSFLRTRLFFRFHNVLAYRKKTLGKVGGSVRKINPRKPHIWRNWSF